MAGSNTQEATDRLTVLKDEISRLDDYEKLIDQHKSVRWRFNIQETVLVLTEVRDSFSKEM